MDLDNIIGLLLALVFGAGSLISRVVANRARRSKIRSYGDSKGFVFEDKDPTQIKNFLQTTPLKEVISNNINVGLWYQGPTYQLTAFESDFDLLGNQQEQTVFLFRLDGFSAPEFMVTPFRSVLGITRMKIFDMNSYPPFEQRFYTAAIDPSRVQRFFSIPLIHFFTRYCRDLTVMVDGPYIAVVLLNAKMNPDNLNQLFQLIGRLVLTLKHESNP